MYTRYSTDTTSNMRKLLKTRTLDMQRKPIDTLLRRAIWIEVDRNFVLLRSLISR